MVRSPSLTRRSLLTVLASSPLLSALSQDKVDGKLDKKHVPVGLEMFSVRHELDKDLPATITAVAKMGYEGVEFFAPYNNWTPEFAGQMRKQLDDLGIWCRSTHNGMQSFTKEGWDKAVQLNKILGTKYIVLASPGRASTTDDWMKVAEALNKSQGRFSNDGLSAGYHNHDAEWKPLEGGKRAMDILADNTEKKVMLQLDVGTCVETGNDPVQWINDHPGRIKSMHLKDWSKNKGYHVLFGEGDVPWRQIFAAAESKGGIEYYLVEQEGSDYPELETADRCLITYRSMHA